MKYGIPAPLAAGVLAALLGNASPLLLADTYQIDPAHSFVHFKISHLGFSTLTGRFNTLRGSYTYDHAKAEASSIQVEVDTASVDTNHAERDKHLRGEDFFEVKKYPKATFVSTAFREMEGGKTAMVEGNLTLHGVTRPISLQVEFIGAGNDPWGGYRRGYIGRTTLKRSDFGMHYNLGPAAETVDLEVVVEGLRK
jgi:polyisoprenoid-binding protein YceI